MGAAQQSRRDQSADALRAETAGHLNKVVRGMDIGTFIVRPARRWVASYLYRQSCLSA